MTDAAGPRAPENAPSRSERLLQIVIDSIPQRVFWKDRNSVYLGCNRAFARDAGLDEPALLVGRNDFDLAWKATAPLYVAYDRAVMESGVPKIDIEEPMTFADGRTIWLRTSKVPLRDETGAVFGLLGSYEDITEQRQAALDRARLAEIVEQANEDVIMTDLAGNITYVNPAFERISGYTRGEVEGRNPRFLKGGLRDAAFYAQLWKTITSGRIWSGRFVNKRKDGTLVEEEGSIFPVRDHAGAIVSYVSIKRDVTQEVRLKEQLQQAQKMESIGQLAGGIAHDFNNLLTAILGFCELVLSDGNPSRRSELEEIKHAGERAAVLTRQLLAFSRKQVFQLEVLDLNDVVVGMEAMLHRLIGEDVRLATSLSSDIGRVKADRSQIEQVLLNLAVNARDAMPGGGVLRIETSNANVDGDLAAAHAPCAPGPYVVLSVSDTGHGMDAETQSRVFEPFFTTKPKGKGTGLGLATVYGIVSQSGGFVSFSTDPQNGTTFRVHLPGAAASAPMKSRSGTHPAVPPKGTETILMVEDDDAVRRLGCHMLERLGYTVLCAESGRHALELARDHPGKIDLILTDVVMPEMSGREVERRLAEAGHAARVLFMSGYSDDAILRHGVLESGVAFLQKPFTLEALGRRVREVLDQPPA